MNLSEGVTIALLTFVVGPILLAIVKAQLDSRKKDTQNANVHVANAGVLSALVEAVEGLHTKMDALDDLHRNEDSIFATKHLSQKVDTLTTEDKGDTWGIIQHKHFARSLIHS